MVRKTLIPLLLILSLAPSCSSNKPPDSIFEENIGKMVLVDRAMGFKEEITGITVEKRTKFEDQLEVQVRVEGWATHKDITIGATLPASKVKKAGWATWKFFCKKINKKWVIVEKYKVKEGFEED